MGNWFCTLMGITYRFQLFPRALDVLLCLTSIMEVLSEEQGKGKKSIRNITRLFTSLGDLKVGEPDLDIVRIIN